MTDKKLIEFVTDFRDGVLNGAPSMFMCAAVCWPLVTLLNMCGVVCESVETELLWGECNHIWIRLADGRALDPTGDQFNDLFPELNMPPVYLGKPIMKLHGRND